MAHVTAGTSTLVSEGRSSDTFKGFFSIIKDIVEKENPRNLDYLKIERKDYEIVFSNQSKAYSGFKRLKAILDNSSKLRNVVAYASTDVGYALSGQDVIQSFMQHDYKSVEDTYMYIENKLLEHTSNSVDMCLIGQGVLQVLDHGVDKDIAVYNVAIAEIEEEAIVSFENVPCDYNINFSSPKEYFLGYLKMLNDEDKNFYKGKSGFFAFSFICLTLLIAFFVIEYPTIKSSYMLMLQQYMY